MKTLKWEKALGKKCVIWYVEESPNTFLVRVDYTKGKNNSDHGRWHISVLNGYSQSSYAGNFKDISHAKKLAILMLESTIKEIKEINIV